MVGNRYRIPRSICLRAARWRILAGGAILLLGLGSGSALQAGETEYIITFQRADVNASGGVDLSDSFNLLAYLFQDGTPGVDCDRAFDIDDNGVLEIVDPIYLLTYQFLSGPAPAAPFGACGTDDTPDTLTCLAYAGCDPIPVEPPIDPAVLEKMGEVSHALRRMAYGQTPALFDRVMEMENGVDDYITEQLDPELIDESGNTTLNSIVDGLNPDSDLYDLYRLQLIRALYSEKQLQEVMTDFWNVHFNTYIWTVYNYFATRTTSAMLPVYTAEEAVELATYFEWKESELFHDNALGVFGDLLMASATSVTMLIYLDNISNIVGAPNENYAREILELHTLGVDVLYMQQDIQQLAKVFTGWGICLVEAGSEDDPHAECQEISENPEADGFVWAFHFNPDNHDYSEKTLFAGTPYEYVIRAGTAGDAEGGLAEGVDFIEYLAALPHTGQFLAEKLCRRFVKDSPPGALVGAAVGTWDDTGGDVRAVVETILTNFRFLAEVNRNNKVKTPIEYMVSTVRAFQGAPDADCTDIIASLDILANLPFNFGTPDGYPEKADDQLGTARILERVQFNKNIFRATDLIDYDDVKEIMQDHDVDLDDAEEVVEFWLGRLFAGIYNEIDVALAVDFLTTNDLGQAQELSSAANSYENRVRKVLAYIASYPQNIKQ